MNSYANHRFRWVSVPSFILGLALARCVEAAPPQQQCACHTLDASAAGLVGKIDHTDIMQISRLQPLFNDCNCRLESFTHWLVS